MHNLFEVVKTRTILLAQRFRWRITAANNKIIASSSEGFYSHNGALANAMLVREALNEAFTKGELTKGE